MRGARRPDAVGTARVEGEQELGQLLDDAAAPARVARLRGGVVLAPAALRDDGVEGLRGGACARAGLRRTPARTAA
jgi:hypothetical protein